MMLFPFCNHFISLHSYIFQRSCTHSYSINFVFQVYADEKLCGTVQYIEDQDVYKIDCVGDDSDPNVFAENIKIMAAADQFLTLCEVTNAWLDSLDFLHEITALDLRSFN